MDYKPLYVSRVGVGDGQGGTELRQRGQVEDSGSVGLCSYVVTSVSWKMVHRHIVADAELLVDGL